MSHAQRPIIATRRGVGATYIPINRYCDDLSLSVVPNGATLTVDYTHQNILRSPDVNELDGSDVIAAASAEWIPVGSLTNNAYNGKLTAFALRLNVTATTGQDIAAAIAEDGGVFTDETTEANSAAADDMTLLPAVPAAGVDRYNFGFDHQASSISLDVSTVGTGTYTIVWEYWNGSTWAALAGVTDGTTNFKTVNAQTVSWTVPSDWPKGTVNTTRDLYWIRAEVQTGTVTQVPVGQRVFDLQPETKIRIMQG